jgi:hypothetical protein
MLMVEMLYRLTSLYHNPFRIARIWVNASFPVVLAADAAGLLISAYVLLVISYLGHFDPVVIWAAHAWRCGKYHAALRRVRLFSWEGGRTPFISFLLAAANLPDKAYAITLHAKIDASDVEDPTYQIVFARGRAALARLDYAAARSNFERFYERFPGAAISRYGLGDCLLWSSAEPERANRLLTAALKDSDRFSLPHWKRLGFEAELRASHAWSFAVLGNEADFQYSHDEALRLAGQARPVRAAVCLRLGNAPRALGRHRAAGEQWAAAYNFDPQGWAGNQAMRHVTGRDHVIAPHCNL